MSEPEEDQIDLLAYPKLNQVCDSEEGCAQVMVVDDIDYNRFALKTMLKHIYKLKVAEASNGKDCIKKLKDLQ